MIHVSSRVDESLRKHFKQTDKPRPEPSADIKADQTQKQTHFHTSADYFILFSAFQKLSLRYDLTQVIAL